MRRNLGEALELLSKTVTGVWSDINPSQNNLDAYLDDGDIMEIKNIVHINEGNEIETEANDSP